MACYRMCSDISFVEDNNQLIILNFETGEYYIVEGICMNILKLIEKKVVEENQIVIELNRIYDTAIYEIEESFIVAIQALKKSKFIYEVEKDEI